MKYLQYYYYGLIGFIILIANGIGNAQNFSDFDMAVRTYTDGNSILIRWMPETYETWSAGNEFGYKLERITTHVNDTALSATQIADSRTILMQNLKPYRESLFDRLFEEDSTYAHVAKMCLYQEDPPPANSSNLSLADAVDKQDNNEIRHLVGMFAADQNFNIARYMALGYEDPCVDGDAYTYQYFIRILDPQEPDSIYTAYSPNIGLRDTTSFPSPEIYAKPGVQKGEIIWEPENYAGIYNSYDIEKSFDGVNFEQLNPHPFVQLVEEDRPTRFATYEDSLAVGEQAYYRITGRTSFGMPGPYSNIDTLVGLHPRISLFLSIDTAIFTTSDTHATLDWSSLGSEWTDTIAGFRLYISDQSNQNYKLLDENYIHPSLRSFDLPPTSLRQYVKLEARDVHGYDYYSTAFLVQPKDITPPHKPTGLSGKYITESQIELKWDENTDRDIQGYRVFVSNGRNKTFVELTEKVINQPIYYYEVGLEMEIDSVYFEVLAADFRENYSERSDVLCLPRPDHIAPDPANLYRVESGFDGIQLAWNFSEARDRVNHILQRRMKGTAKWVTVLDIEKGDEHLYEINLTPGELSATHFIDSTELNIREYEYRMLCYDDSDNFSVSPRIVVTPYDDGLRGEVQNLNVRYQFYRGELTDSVRFDAGASIIDSFLINDTIMRSNIEFLVSNNVITQSEYDSLSQLQSTSQDYFDFLVMRMVELFSDVMNVRVICSWDYSHMHALREFEIYRSVNGSTLRTYFTTDAQPVTQHAFFDDDVRKGWTCSYSLIAYHGDGGFSNMSTELSIDIPDY